MSPARSARSVSTARLVRDLVLWSVFWAAYAVIVPIVMLSPQGIAVIYAGGGIAAGALILMPRARWWIVLVPLAAAVAYVWIDQGMPLGHVALRTIADVCAVTLYAYLVHRHRRRGSGLGADLTWVALGAVLAAVLRLSAVLGLAMLQDSPMERELWNASIEIGMSTIVGLVAGSATVIGLSGWQRRMIRPGAGPRTAGTIALVVGVIVAAYLTPLGGALPALQFLIFPALLLAALIVPVPVMSLLTGASLIVISMAVGQGWGVFAAQAPADSAEVLAAQTFMLAIAVSVFLLSASTADRRRALAQAQAAASLMSASFRQSPTAAALVWLADGRPTVIREANPAFEELAGAPAGGLTARDLVDVLVPLDTDGEPLPASTGLPVGVDIRVVVGERGTRWLRPALSAPLHDAEADAIAEGVPVGQRSREFAVLVLEDVTAERTSEELLRQQARRDSLTGLPNRVALVERLEEDLGSDPVDGDVGLVLVDIDGLQTINDTLGHAAGDQVVIECARRLAEHADPEDLLVRFGGDEFAIVRAGGRSGASAVGTLLSRAVDREFAVGDRDVTLTLTGGIASSRGAGMRAVELVRRADIALLRAKRAGRGSVAEFEEGDERPLLERVEMESRLRRAIAEGSVVCVFQPTAAMSSGRIVGVEALARLRTEEGSLLPAGAFLPLAQELGLMPGITLNVLEQACRAAATWSERGLAMRVAVNVPPSWLGEGSAPVIEGAIARHGLAPGRLTVEVTEEATLAAGQAALDALARMRASGVHVAIDDFGTGYAGLDSFRSLPADIVKIDMTFIADMLRSPEDRELVRAMVDLIHRFGKTCVAEGVETVDQWQALGEMGCDVVQGYFVGRPVPFDEVPTSTMRGMHGQPGT